MLLRPFAFLLIFFITFQALSQPDTTRYDRKSKNRYGLWFIPSASANIYGIAIGPIGSEAICQRPYTKKSHGLNIQIPGQGFMQLFQIGNYRFSEFRDNDSIFQLDSLYYTKAKHNGVLLSIFGTFTDEVNGVSVSLWMSMGKTMNGFSLNPLWSLYEQSNGLNISMVNHTVSTKGIQIGLINKTKKLRGFQFGLWNVNEKRSLPILNWNFRE